MSTLDRPCLLHVPHKLWAGDQQERENYTAMERWSRANLLGWITNHSLLKFHVPHKDWRGNAEERQNYESFERWVRTFTGSFSGVAYQRLHFPFIDWANNHYERENYLAIVRWSRDYYKCFPGSC